MSLLIPAAFLLLSLGQEPSAEPPSPGDEVSPVIIRPATPPPPPFQRPVRVKPGVVGVTDFDRISCRREAVVGSRRRVKICDTALGWQRREDQAEMLMDPGRRTTGDQKGGGG